jgi:hypothetical protein
MTIEKRVVGSLFAGGQRNARMISAGSKHLVFTVSVPLPQLVFPEPLRCRDCGRKRRVGELVSWVAGEPSVGGRSRRCRLAGAVDRCTSRHDRIPVRKVQISPITVLDDGAVGILDWPRSAASDSLPDDFSAVSALVTRVLYVPRS